MTATRVHPFDLLFGAFREQRFPAIAAEPGSRRTRDEFMLASAALELMRDMRPDDGLGDAVDDFVALVHAAYLYWSDGEQTVEFGQAQTRALVATAAVAPRSQSTAVRYIQVAPRLLWAQLAEDGPFEPLDGWFEQRSPASLRMVACLGVHPERPGVSVAVVEGTPVPGWSRPDRSALFSPLMSGGDAADLLAVSAPEELLLLGWRALASENTDQGGA